MLADLNVFDLLGVLGSFCIAGAYLAVSRGWVAAVRPAFQLLNLVGALLILLSLYFRPNLGAIIIEVLWVIIAVWSLISWWRKQ